MGAFFYILLGLVAFSCNLQAQSLTIPLPYINGRTLCKAITNENGFFVSAPIDYSGNLPGQFEIYAWFQGGFNPKLPTLAFFEGGPGQTSHWGKHQLENPKYNVLLMDQRGMGCSRPPKFTEYFNFKFYSSENTARDLETIRRSLKINQLTVYGLSYGTIPATIYGSLFPTHTSSVILEGTVFSSESLGHFEKSKSLIEREIALLPKSLKDSFKSMEIDFPVKQEWFFRWAREFLESNNGLAQLKESFQNLAQPGKWADLMHELPLANLDQHAIKNYLFVPDDVPYYMISCVELGLSSLDNSRDQRLLGDKVIAVPWADYIPTCQSLGTFKTQDYLALNYPLNVPVTYFQGENDSATEVGGALAHFQNVARGKKQMLILSQGGHNPNLELLGAGFEEEMKLVEAAVYNISITQKNIDMVNSTLENLKWSLVSPLASIQ